VTAPKVGKHAFVREKAIPRYGTFYGHISKDEAFIVDRIDKSRGRGTVYLRRKGDDQLIPVWRNDVKPVPRCDYCDEEGHTKSSATQENCRVARETAVRKKVAS